MDAAANMAAARTAKAPAHAGAQYLKPGKYRLEVQAIKAKDGTKGLSAIAEFKVIAAEKTEENLPNAVGSVVSYVEKLDDAQKGGGSRFKALLLALLNEAEADVTDAQIAAFYGEKQPGTCLQVDCDAFTKTYTPKGSTEKKSLTGTKWTAIANLNIADVDGQRAALKLPPFAKSFE